MQQLMDDWRKREEKFSLERATREKEAEKRVQEMQWQVGILMKLVSESSKAKVMAATPVGHGPLVPLTMQDDIESYLVTFERIMEAYKVPKEQWTYYLTPQLTSLRSPAPSRVEDL